MTYIQRSYILPQSQSGIQLSIFARLDIPHGHVDLPSHLEDCISRNVEPILVNATESLKEDSFAQYMTFQDATLDKMLDNIISMLLPDFFDTEKIKRNKAARATKTTATCLKSHYIRKPALEGLRVWRQAIGKDIGFATNRDTARFRNRSIGEDEDNLGCSKPRMLAGTEDEL